MSNNLTSSQAFNQTVEHINRYKVNGVAKLSDAQIADHNVHGSEFIKTKTTHLIQISGSTARAKVNWKDMPSAGTFTRGRYFYCWSKPLLNYYHTIYDTIGCLYHYFNLKADYPDLRLLINCVIPGLSVYPPYIEELFNLLDIEWEYTDQDAVYETVFVGGSLRFDNDGNKIKLPDKWFVVLNKLISSALDRNLDVPRFDNIYLSRRTHLNPNYSKELIGEDNTQKRRNINEDRVVDVLENLGYVEVFGENYTLAEKITIFHYMKKYVTNTGAGITNALYRKSGIIGVINSPNLELRKNKPHPVLHTYYNNTISLYDGTSFANLDTTQLPAKRPNYYNQPWKIDDIDAFKEWAQSL